MYWRLNADGTRTEETAEEAWERILAECVAEWGEDRGRKHAEDRWEALNIPLTPEEVGMTEGERSLARRMQSEQGVNEAAARAGFKSIFDLPSASDPSRTIAEVAAEERKRRKP